MRLSLFRLSIAASLTTLACGGGDSETTGARPTGPMYSDPPASVGSGGAQTAAGGGAVSGGGATTSIPGDLTCGIDGCHAAAGSGGMVGGGAAGAAGAAAAGAGSGGASVGGKSGSAGSAGSAPIAGSAGSDGGFAGSGGGVPIGGAQNGGAGGAGGPAGGAGGLGTAGTSVAGSGGFAGSAAGFAGAAGSVGGSAGSASVSGSAGAAGGPSLYPAPTAYWPLDVVQGVATAEQTTARGAMLLDVTSVAGLSGKAMRIGSIDSYMWVPATVWAQPLSAFTVSMWVKPEDDWTGLFGHDFLRRGNALLSRFGTNTTFSVGADSVVVSAPMVQDHWYHIVASYASGSEMVVSVEDSVAPGAVTSTLQPGTGVVPATGPLDVFRVPGGAFHAGAIDDVAIFDRALSAAERASLYVLGTTGQSPVCPGCAPALDPIHAFRFEEASYDRATSEVMQARASATTGFSDEATGQVGDGLHASEVLASGAFQPGSGVVVPADPALHPHQFTLSAWIRPDRTISTNDTQMAWFKSNNVLPNRGFWFGYDQGLTLTLGDGTTGNVPRQTQSLPLAQGVWHHVAATYDGDKSVLYMDGKVAGAAQLTSAYDPGIAEPLRLCGNDSSAIGRPVFPGVCDEMAIFSVALSPAEVQAVFERGSQFQPLF